MRRLCWSAALGKHWGHPRACAACVWLAALARTTDILLHAPLMLVWRRRARTTTDILSACAARACLAALARISGTLAIAPLVVWLARAVKPCRVGFAAMTATIDVRERPGRAAQLGALHHGA